MLQFLADIEAGENASTCFISFTFFRIHYEGPTVPERPSRCFGSIEDPAKTKEWSKDACTEGFPRICLWSELEYRAYCPTGWLLENEEVVPLLANLAAEKVSVIDIL